MTLQAGRDLSRPLNPKQDVLQYNQAEGSTDGEAHQTEAKSARQTQHGTGQHTVSLLERLK